jgi:L-arabinose isomerase
MAGGEMLKITGENKMAAAVNGWFRPDAPLERFLEGLSLAGATHHSALVYGVTPEQLAPLADFLGCERHIVG